jgi:nicotinate-nucleotide pyrophosphorylase (carboxylating)
MTAPDRDASPGRAATADRLELPLSQEQRDALVRAALEEDRAFEDVTTLSTVPDGLSARASLVARSPGVIAGGPLAAAAFRLIDPQLFIEAMVDDGEHVGAGTVVMRLSGSPRSLLSAERVALNFAQRLSGIATLTARYVEAVRGTRARILDTRKTTPLFRALEKYAVRAGGGMSHRSDLADAVLIKDNHIAALGGDTALAVRRACELAPAGTRIEVECENVAQVSVALSAGADIVLLDNMTTDDMRVCVARAAGRAILEASGGVNLSTVRAIAETGVDWISVGALTHSAPALDLALDFEEIASPSARQSL